MAELRKGRGFAILAVSEIYAGHRARQRDVAAALQTAPLQAPQDDESHDLTLLNFIAAARDGTC